jgi:FkbM family methyltransferase
MSSTHKKRGPLTALRGFAHWFEIFVLRRERVRVRISEPPIDLYVKANTIFSWHLRKYHQWEPDITQWMTAAFAGQRIVFIDVGANLGWFSCVMAKICKPDSYIMAIEPGEANLPFLTENIAHNSIKNIRVIERAMGARQGTALLNSGPPGNPGMHSIVKMEHLSHDDAQLVNVSTLDAECQTIPGNIDLIKIDVEGYELDVLRGGEATLKRTNTIVLEYSPTFLRAAGNEPFALIEFLRDLGFSFFEISAGNLLASDLETLKRRTLEATEPFAQWMLVCQRVKPIKNSAQVSQPSHYRSTN